MDLELMELRLSQSLATKIIHVVAYFMYSTNLCYAVRPSDSILIFVLMIVRNESTGMLLMHLGLSCDRHSHDSNWHYVKIKEVYLIVHICNTVACKISDIR